MAITMHGRNAVSGSLGECYVTIDGTRYNFMQAINVEAKVERTKVEVPILGKTGKGNKSTGWKGTGNATFHYNTSIFRQVMEHYKDTNEDIYFDMVLTNEDPTSQVGRQTMVLIDCSLDDVIIAKVDADADYLDEEINFTFEDWKISEAFKSINGML